MIYLLCGFSLTINGVPRRDNRIRGTSDQPSCVAPFLPRPSTREIQEQLHGRERVLHGRGSMLCMYTVFILCLAFI